MENKIRIQPGMIEIPTDNPFDNDLLNRKTPIEALTNVISNIEGPCVMAVDAPWGMGKTTFIRMWEQHLRNKNFPVVSFNAWETDYFADPFAALSSELLRELEDFRKRPSVDKNSSILLKQLRKLKRAIKTVSKQSLPVLRVLADAVDSSGWSKAAVQIAAARMEAASKNHRNTHGALKEFRETLGKTASVFAEEARQRPLIIVIDELDRCRPSYAIELLEIAKHFFSVDRIVFVLAVNFSELSHSVRAVYGEEFNARGYLERFFDIDFKLPDADRKLFIQENFQAMKIDQYFGRTADKSAKKYFPEIAEVFTAFFGNANISLRKISQVIRRLGLILAALPSNQLFLGWASAIALVLRTIDFELYEEFINRKADDKQVIDTIFARSEFTDIKNQPERNLFEAVIIMACAELRSDGAIFLSGNLSPHYATYERQAEPVSNQARIKSVEDERAKTIVAMVEQLKQDAHRSMRISFPTAIERIELFSANLVREDAPQN